MMLNLNLFFVAAVWMALIATVSVVSAAKEPEAAAASDFTREDIVQMELEEQERELANYGVPYSNGYAAYGSNSYSSGNSYPDRYTNNNNNNNNNHGYSTPPATTGYAASYPATGYDRYPTYKRTSTTSYSGGGYSSRGGYYGGKGGKGGGYYGGKGGKGGYYSRGGNNGGSFYYSGSSSTPVYTTNSYGTNHGSSGNYGKTYGHGSSNGGSSSHNNGYGKTYDNHWGSYSF